MLATLRLPSLLAIGAPVFCKPLGTHETIAQLMLSLRGSLTAPHGTRTMFCRKYQQQGDLMAAAQPKKIRMVAGLGNPGDEYAATRHNEIGRAHV